MSFTSNLRSALRPSQDHPLGMTPVPNQPKTLKGKTSDLGKPYGLERSASVDPKKTVERSPETLSSINPVCASHPTHLLNPRKLQTSDPEVPKAL